MILLDFLYEWCNARSVRAMHSAIRSAQTINDTSLPSRPGFVFLQPTSVEYAHHFDANVNYSLSGAIIAWSPEYCQWQDAHASWRENFSMQQTWADQPSPSGHYFHGTDRAIPSYAAYRLHLDATCGSITLSRELFQGTQPQEFYSPNASDLRDFGFSAFHQAGFFYFENGYFYRSQEKPIKGDCQIGDVRGRHLVFAPASISVFGWLENATIRKGSWMGETIGGVRSGLVSAEEVLETPGSRMFWPLRAVLLARVMPLIWELAANTLERAWYFALSGFTWLFVKSIVWSRPWMRAEVWGMVALGAWTSFWMTRNARRRM